MKIDFTPRLQFTAAIAGIAIGVGGLVLGEVDKAKANKKASQLAASRPKLTDSPYTKDELALQESELASGFGADASRFQKEQQDSDLSSSLDAILKGGGSVNNVAQVFDGSQRGNQRLALTKENLRLNQINNLVSASRNADAERQQEFQFNQDAPWKDESQAVAAEKQGAQQEISSGVNTAASGAVQALGNYSQEKSLNDYFKPKTGPGGASTGSFQSPDYSSLETGGLTPNVAGSVSGSPKPLNLDFNNSSNTDVWTQGNF